MLPARKDRDTRKMKSPLTYLTRASAALSAAGEATSGASETARTERRGGDERRNHSLQSFCYGGFRPRRRTGRRGGDEHAIFLDWHEPRVLYLVLAILLMSCTDALFTLNILAAGGQELNVLMDWLIDHETGRFVAVKIGLTALSLIVLVAVAHRKFLGRVPVIRLLQLFCAGYVALLVYEAMLIGSYVSRTVADGQSIWSVLFG
jgi:hypothetical protein